MNATATKTYLIREGNLAELRHILDRLCRKAEKLGTAPVSYSLGATVDQPYSKEIQGKLVGPLSAEQTQQAEKLGKLVFIRFREVTITGATPRLAGWEFVATLQHLADENGATINVLRVAPGFDAQLPEQYRTATAENCDHCHKAIRTRKETFIVRHEDGTWKQVGRNCTQDFLGGLDPHKVAAGLENLLRAFAEAEEAGGRLGSGGGSPDSYSTRNFLEVVATLVRRDGWTSRGRARELGEGFRATADDALNYLNPPPLYSQAYDQWEQWVAERPVTDEDRATAARALEFAREDLAAKDSRSDYEHNLYVAANQPAIGAKLAGITASLIPYYLREVERQVLRETERQQLAGSKHFGAIGDRLTFEVQVAKVITVGELSQFGPSYLHKLITPEGNLVIWFSSNSGNNLTPGQKYIVKASIKKHDSRDGIQQTVVSRLTVLTPEQVEKEQKKAARAAAKEKQLQ